MPFIKMHGAGNDFVFLSRENTSIPITNKLAQLLLDRHFGVGGDQLLVLTPGTSTQIPSLKIYNADGSLAEMCGNGVRSVAFYLMKYKQYRKNFSLQTDAGEIGIQFKGKKIEVDMGEPVLEGRKIPVRARGPIVNKSIQVKGKTYKIHAVSMGNPHCVIYVKNVTQFPVKEIGPLIEKHLFFPNRVNVEFVQVLRQNHVRVRVWERGAGETLACGTGACAVAVAGARFGNTSRNVKIDLPGGSLQVRWGENNHVYLSGPSEVTFSGTFLIG
ncbi:diaminopimelate epimerase [bacterium F11]|nr:diaminopimelate epimerase [bacterium F11]